ncbi:LacI family DNA-binding transcriptional regulator [Telmatospirillum siberiense]|uniref:Transcriptional regulator n=1 Tax=Telmatospirillum siberiense TaxID=382514 RepID=A0A2N3PXF3_9PROT|nr:LacI family DNA-binding transcriptional regulator [Telmatospirillum siberiense]PKU25084.1 transcriptional regulator [Telmatospirillum siberiense]
MRFVRFHRDAKTTFDHLKGLLVPGSLPPDDPTGSLKQIDPTPGEPHPAPSASGAITLGDVARLAGVSPSTVSRVLNRPELVNAKTTEAVRAAIAETAYVPNLLAGGLASKRSRLVAAIVPTIANSIFTEAVEALTDRLEEAGYHVLLGLTGYPATREAKLVEAILSRRPEGVFLTGVNHAPETYRRLRAAGIPVVETWDITDNPIDVVIGFSHAAVGRAVATYLTDKGYRRLAMVWADDERAKIRRQGFLAALSEKGIGDVRTSMVPAPGNLQRGREGLARLLDEPGPSPQAVFCSSDALAQGVLAEAQARHLTIPGDLAVIGFGDLDLAAYTYPALTTVRIDRHAIGLKAAEAMLARIDGRQEVERTVDIGFRLIERAST